MPDAVYWLSESKWPDTEYYVRKPLRRRYLDGQIWVMYEVYWVGARARFLGWEVHVDKADPIEKLAWL